MVRNVAIRTQGSEGASGVDSNGFRRILGSKSFKKSGIELCEAIATMTRRLSTEYIDPVGVEAHHLITNLSPTYPARQRRGCRPAHRSR